MQTLLTANQAKTNFGEMLLQAQRSPVQISKNGKPVAVVVSFEEYQALEEIKQAMILERFETAKKEIAEGKIVDGSTFMADLISGKFDGQ